MPSYRFNDQFFMNLCQFPAYADHVVLTEVRRKVLQGLADSVWRLEKHSEMVGR